MESCTNNIDYNANPLQSNTQYIPVPREQVKKSIELCNSHHEFLLDMNTSFSSESLDDCNMGMKATFQNSTQPVLPLSSLSDHQCNSLASAVKPLKVLNLVFKDKMPADEVFKFQQSQIINDSLKQNYACSKVFQCIPNHESVSCFSEENRLSTKDESSFKKENVHPENTLIQEDIFYAMNQFDWAAQIIQSYWRSYRNYQKNVKVLNIRNEIRNRRLEDHLLYLIFEIKKSQKLYEQEKCLRMLQMEAIRSLWKEIKMLIVWKNEVLKMYGVPSKEVTLENQAKKQKN